MLKQRSLRQTKSVGQQARDAVVDMILRQNMKVGDKLPSETELSQTFDISRPMLREALRLLEQEGLVRTEHGRGRFLSAASALTIARPITAYESITVMLRELGYTPETKVLSWREGRADEDEIAATALGCTPDTSLIFVERLRVQGSDPLVYSIEVVPRDCLPAGLGADDLAGSLNDLLGRQQQQPRMSSASVTATDLPMGVGGLINSHENHCWLLITETCLTDEGVPVVYARDYHRGDLFSFNFSRR
ncbi:GntR family transcriptional regulator [Acidisoma cladoniae]|jgi:GntR family transcriptional regulator|uniref:GntR family transcriptional regulator n=1 Tax=Acidisoma cladoniae TaxID=3040935 RepID=UPI002550D613|nr:GntR family transcriptional regulator [Acidisoma sp. PAMC 29798]